MLLPNAAGEVHRGARDEKLIDSPLEIGTNAGVELSAGNHEIVKRGRAEVALQPFLDRSPAVIENPKYGKDSHRCSCENSDGRRHNTTRQGRYQSFLVEEDQHFLAVARYVQQKALRANLGLRAEGWQKRIAKRLRLESAYRPTGWPRKAGNREEISDA